MLCEASVIGFEVKRAPSLIGVNMEWNNWLADFLFLEHISVSISTAACACRGSVLLGVHDGMWTRNGHFLWMAPG